MEQNYKLSICVCSVLSRATTFLPKILGQLQNQIKGYEDKVEILCLLDNKTIMLGDKRNMLVKIAEGDYIIHLDDDDVISDDYISTLVETVEKNQGISQISFIVDVSLNGNTYKPCYYSFKYGHDYNESHCYRRIPNHICAVRKDLAKNTPFKSIIKGEDSAYAKDLLPKLKDEVMIDKVLYFYNYSDLTTEIQQKLKPRNA
jgi:glycosyltransferase involved in cell wall biosynthesis